MQMREPMTVHGGAVARTAILDEPPTVELKEHGVNP
jgi:hypothetical protein